MVRRTVSVMVVVVVCGKGKGLVWPFFLFVFHMTWERAREEGKIKVLVQPVYRCGGAKLGRGLPRFPAGFESKTR